MFSYTNAFGDKQHQAAIEEDEEEELQSLKQVAADDQRLQRPTAAPNGRAAVPDDDDDDDDDDCASSSLSSLHTPTTVPRTRKPVTDLTPGEWLLNSHHLSTDAPASSGPNVANPPEPVMSRDDSTDRSSSDAKHSPNVTLNRNTCTTAKYSANDADEHTLDHSVGSDLNRAYNYNMSTGTSSSVSLPAVDVAQMIVASPSAADADVRSLIHQSSASQMDSCKGVSTPRESARHLPEGSPMWAQKHLEQTGNVNVIEDELIKPQLLKAPSRLKSFMSPEMSPEHTYRSYQDSNHSARTSHHNAPAPMHMASPIVPAANTRLPPSLHSRPDYPASTRPPTGQRSPLVSPSTHINASVVESHYRPFPSPAQSESAWGDHAAMERERERLQEIREEEEAAAEVREAKHQEALKKEMAIREEDRKRAAEFWERERAEAEQRRLQSYENHLSSVQELAEQRHAAALNAANEVKAEEEAVEQLEKEVRTLREETAQLESELTQKEAQLASERAALSDAQSEKAARIQKIKEMEASRVTFVPVIGDCMQSVRADGNSSTAALATANSSMLQAPCLLPQIPPNR